MKVGRAVPLRTPAHTALRGVMLSGNFGGLPHPLFLLPAHIRASTGRSPWLALPTLGQGVEGGIGPTLEKTEEAQESEGLFLPCPMGPACP